MTCFQLRHFSIQVGDGVLLNNDYVVHYHFQQMLDEQRAMIEQLKPLKTQNQRLEAKVKVRLIRGSFMTK
jgi:hypothetical protein